MYSMMTTDARTSTQPRNSGSGVQTERTRTRLPIVSSTWAMRASMSTGRSLCLHGLGDLGVVVGVGRRARAQNHQRLEADRGHSVLHARRDKARVSRTDTLD